MTGKKYGGFSTRRLGSSSILLATKYMYFEIDKSEKITVGEVVSAEHQDI